ncbi:MAG: transposase [Bryobacterales bacterium]|nr:transposase [Bryobacterales bacterium]
MLAQRIYALALGYEDLNDHEQLRHDPMLTLLSGNKPGPAPAGKSTLNRMELSPAGDGLKERYSKISYSAQAATIRPRLLKIAARLRVTARRIWMSYSSAYAWRNQFEVGFAALHR